ncbi:MAG: hypothetical protein UY63_C0017G0049 [Parcubacteria group bacterium GW2011_GWA2_51_10]|nr:MAG: hypothetical protein UY63_C0017G0049 [Parcubacteria group bacterium GW2011_GWA2_51_10]
MEEQSVREIIKATHWPRTMAATALGVLALFLLVSTVGELKALRFIGSGVPATNTITVSGDGEVFAVPDTATFSVAVRETAKEVKDAQDVATKKGNDIIAYLKQAGVPEKDIKTTDYSVQPQYEWSRSVCPAGSEFCPPGKQVLTGFQVSQTLSVKVRDTKKAGDLLSGVGSRGASEVSGLSFTIDDEDALKAEARDKAIKKAQEKAEVLARSLGVSLVRVVGFYESEGPMPYYAYGMGGDERALAAPMKAPAPDVPVGENKIVSNVTVTYEIK